MSSPGALLSASLSASAFSSSRPPGPCSIAVERGTRLLIGPCPFATGRIEARHMRAQLSQFRNEQAQLLALIQLPAERGHLLAQSVDCYLDLIEAVQGGPQLRLNVGQFSRNVGRPGWRVLRRGQTAGFDAEEFEIVLPGRRQGGRRAPARPPPW